MAEVHTLVASDKRLEKANTKCRKLTILPKNKAQPRVLFKYIYLKKEQNLACRVSMQREEEMLSKQEARLKHIGSNY